MRTTAPMEITKMCASKRVKVSASVGPIGRGMRRAPGGACACSFSDTMSSASGRAAASVAACASPCFVIA